MISFSEARVKVLLTVDMLPAEPCPLPELAGRILAQDVASSFDIPPRDNSAMDGFAVRFEDIRALPAVLEVVEDAPAGKVASKTVGKGQAIRIMTGAQIPEGADCVIPVELTEAGTQETEVRILNAVQLGEHIRRRGEDVKAGEVLINKGTRLRPQEVGLIASLGMTEAMVSRKPVVGILSSGNEIVQPGGKLGPGQIYDANRYSVAAQARSANAEVRDYGIVEDDLVKITAALERAAGECDLLLTSGGVSVGDYDLMKQALSKLGEMNFWQVAQKPGKPMAFGHIGGKPVMGLPGNPVSSMVVFGQYVRPLLLKMQGASTILREQLTAVSDQEIIKPAGRMEFMRAAVEWRDGHYHAILTGPQGSGILTSMVRADGFVILPEEAARVLPGDKVTVELF